MESKPAIQSLTLWGGSIALLPGLIDLLGEVANLPIVPPHVAIVVSSVGSLLAILGRVFGGQSKISGIVKVPRK